MLAIVAPGQGSQSSGFLASWLDHPPYAERLAAYAAGLGLDLAHLGTEASDDVLVDTAVAQPLLVAAGLAAGRLLLDTSTASKTAVVAGHSVGELTAAALAGVLSDQEALDLAVVRGRAMAAAAADRPGGMTAIVGGDREAVGKALARHRLTLATVNAADQVVAAGPRKRLAALAADPPAGARLLPLRVAGAFHTDHMRPALDRVRRAAALVGAVDPRVPLVSNRDGEVLRSGQDVLDGIVTQVVRPVRWDRCLATMAELGVTGLLELPPAGTLTAIARRVLPGVRTVALTHPDRLVAAEDLLARHLAR